MRHGDLRSVVWNARPIPRRTEIRAFDPFARDRAGVRGEVQFVALGTRRLFAQRKPMKSRLESSKE